MKRARGKIDLARPSPDTRAGHWDTTGLRRSEPIRGRDPGARVAEAARMVTASKTTLYVLAIAGGLAFSFGMTLALASRRSEGVLSTYPFSPAGRGLAPSPSGGGLERGGPIELAPLVITAPAARASPSPSPMADDAQLSAALSWRRCSPWQPLLMGSGEVRLCE